MKIDFNRQINRKHTDCAKWDGQGGDYIPLWIADMDLPVAEPVLEALKNRLEHPFLGYTFPGESVYQTEKEVEKENLAGSTLHCGTLQYAASASIDDATGIASFSFLAHENLSCV